MSLIVRAFVLVLELIYSLDVGGAEA